MKYKIKRYTSIIWKMSIVDMKRKYKASILSWFWLILQPALMVFTYWFSFQSGNMFPDGLEILGVNYNYLQWLLIGVLTWSYCGDILLSGPSAIKNYIWISKSFGAPPYIQSIFVNISKFLIGVLLMVVAFIVSMIINGVEGRPVATLSALEIPLIFIFMFFFMLAWSYFLSPIVAISRDMQNIILTIPMILGWVSGVFIVPTGVIAGNENEIFNIILQINPFNFLINGTRSSMMGYGSIFIPSIYNEWYSILSFFLFLGFFFGAGYLIHRKTTKFLLDII